MVFSSRHLHDRTIKQRLAAVALLFMSLLVTPFNVFSQDPAELPDTIHVGEPIIKPAVVIQDRIEFKGDSLEITPVDTIPIDEGPVAVLDSIFPGSEWNQEWIERKVEYNPDPTRAVWMSALFPGLGQIYNRRYWKLPIIVGGYLGLGYATSWNNSMLTDYTRAYADLTDNDPSTKSYMDFFPKTIKEEDLDKSWLNDMFKRKKNFYRRNRDLCIICMVGVYFLAMIDAYVDASLAHFDISPDLSMDVVPTLIQDSRGQKPAIGLHWALCF